MGIFSTIINTVGKAKVFTSVGKGVAKAAKGLKIINPETTQKFLEERGENKRAKQLGKTVVVSVGVITLLILVLTGKIDGETFERLFIHLTEE